jgi:DNA-binding transcriptional LysR family regulator
MDTQSLQAFVEVAEQGSFSEAAEQLHLTQPAVSKRIAVLEQQLDSKLFDRIGRNISLTEAGRALLPQAQRILQSVQEAQHSIRDLQGSVSGSLSLGISHHIGLHRLPPVLQQFSKQYPKVKLDIDFMDSEQAYEQILHGKIELAVVTLAQQQVTPFQQQAIWQDELMACVAPDHPLNQQQRVNLQTLSHYTAILPGLSTYTGQIIKRLFQQHQLKLDVSMATNYLETIKMMVSIGLGWSVLPSTMIDGSLRTVAIKDLHLQRDLGYVYHRDRSLTNAASAFIDILEQQLAKNG